MTIETIPFGQSDIQITPLIFGGNVFGWTLDEPKSFQILDDFVDKGFNAIDTSNNYSHWVEGNKGGESETIIGNWLIQRGRRDQVILMTKVGGRFGYESKPNVRGAYIKEQVEESLRRLKTDYIDLYQTHYDDEVTPIEETLRAYEDLIKEGKVRYIGASNIGPERLVESLDIAEDKNLPKYISLQPEYNLFDRAKFENLYQKLALEKQIAVIPYYSLASGFLSGKYQLEEDFAKTSRGKGIKDKYWNERGRQIVQTQKEIAEKYNVSPSAVALAWLLAQPSITAPIASATKSEHIVAFVDALQLKLAEEDIQKLTEASKY
ncbi:MULTISPECIES: aldo/keto reductase [Sphingobacterium]|uniref:Aldo/keto reductase n=1 Tax=Sphingobacterium litopenaei TaxID=2763500 RepID=A0ABR7YGQ2_9SPHI|nr:MULTISPECIES: aldo/keto reductase [Sphingobacterium]MBD1430460.1 aldo/keto reductase [Sphingobacterium litopenaei]NGM73560.1 aldo/keto reductase [Sphingobacterium sp. SGL-16]